MTSGNSVNQKPEPVVGPSDDPMYLTTPEAAVLLRVSESYLEKLRVYGGGPIFIRPSGRKIIYKRSDLLAWADTLRRRSTSEYGSAPADGTDLLGGGDVC